MNTINNNVTSEADIYGTRDFPIDSLSVAKFVIANHIEEIDIDDFRNLDFIHLSKAIELFDANDQHAFTGFNFEIPEENLNGLVVIAAHTRAPLIKEIELDSVLPEDISKIYYFSEGEFYLHNSSNYKTLTNIEISINEFEILKAERSSALSNLTLELLYSIELDTVSMLNNMVDLTTISDEDFLLQKKYEGQDSNAYGYGGINNVSTYLKNRYGGTVSYTSGKMLTMQSFKMTDFNNKNNCSLTAITRMLMFYRAGGNTKIDSTKDAVYKKVLAKAKKHGYTEKNGTSPTKINNIIQEVLRDYGYKNSTSKGIYIWTFNDQVKKEIDANRPVIMNIARGYYGNHSVTVNGYKNYKTTKKTAKTTETKTHNMIAIYDGWASNQRYIDYQAFSYDLISSGFGSFNTAVVKN